MALSEDSKTSIAFKKLITKDHRFTTNAFYEETDGGGFNVHADNVWSDTVPGTAPSASTASIVVYSGPTGAIALNQDVTVPNSRGWFAGPTGPDATDEANRWRSWVPPKYGQSYNVALYEDNGSGTAPGSQIFTTDAADWFFDYDTGYLSIQDTHSFQTPLWIEAYRYIGNVVSSVKNRTFVKFLYIEDPLATDVFPMGKVADPATIVKVTHITDTGTVDFNIEKRAQATPGSAGTDLWSGDKQADNTNTEETSFDSESISEDEWIVYAASAVASSPTKLWISVEYTVD